MAVARATITTSSRNLTVSVNVSKEVRICFLIVSFFKTVLQHRRYIYYLYYSWKHPLGPPFKPATVAPPITKQTEIGKARVYFNKTSLTCPIYWLLKVDCFQIQVVLFLKQPLKSHRAKQRATLPSPNHFQQWEDIRYQSQVKPNWNVLDSVTAPLCVYVSYMALVLFLRVMFCRCNPSSDSRPHHHRSAAAHDRLSSQTCSSQAEESPTAHHGGVRLPHQWHVPVANQPREAEAKIPRSEKEKHGCGHQSLSQDFFSVFAIFFLQLHVSVPTSGWKHPNSAVTSVSEHVNFELSDW